MVVLDMGSVRSWCGTDWAGPLASGNVLGRDWVVIDDLFVCFCYLCFSFMYSIVL